MRKAGIHISLTIMVPFILGGVAALALFFADHILGGRSAPPPFASSRLVWSAAVVGAVVYIVATLMLLIVFRPLRRFLEWTKDARVLPGAAASEADYAPMHHLERFDRVFDQVANVLDKLEAKALFPEIIGESRAMRGLFTQILKVAPSDATVLLTGPSGTGKELAAKSIHGHSPRKNAPLVAVNCAAIPHDLLESELFGHEKGAFTGAVAQKKGKFELAHQGALFLDEIGDMPPETQAKILRALQNREAERLGGTRPIKFDVRVIAATNQDLTARIKEGKFREDLYHRLNVFAIDLPPLRRRPEDIPLLAAHFLERSGRELRLSNETLQLLLTYDWPGNVRELENAMARAAVLAESDTVRPQHLPKDIVDADRAGRAAFVPANGDDRTLDLDAQLAETEKSLIIAALTRTGGVQARAAELLGVKPRSLWHRIKKYDIDASAIKRRLSEQPAATPRRTEGRQQAVSPGKK